MPIEPTWEETESVEEPKWEDTTDVETKTPGFLGPAFPLQEGEPSAPLQQAAPIPQEVMQDVPWMTRFRMSPVGRTLLGPTEEEKAGMAGEASGARIKPQEIAEQALEATTPAKALPFLSQIAPFVPLSPISPLLGGLPKAFESGIKEAAINFPLAPLPGPKTAAGRAALVAFGSQFLASQPETLKAFKDAIKRKDYDEATKIAATELAMAAGLGLGGKEALAKTKPPALPAQKAIAAAEPILPQAAQAAKETKGTEYATEERNVPQDISGERAGDDTLRTPPSPSSSGSLPTTTAIPQTETPSAAPQLSRLLLSSNPTVRVADPSVLVAINDPKILDTVVRDLPVEVMDMLATEQVPSEVLRNNPTMFEQSLAVNRDPNIASSVFGALKTAVTGLRAKLLNAFTTGRDVELSATLKASDLTSSEIVRFLAPDGKGTVDISGMPEFTTASARAKLRSLGFTGTGKKLTIAEFAPLADWHTKIVSKAKAEASGIGVSESTPPPKETPTAPSAAEPSQLTPATQGISEATTPSEKSQVSAEKFLGQTKEGWTEDYYKSLNEGNRKAARVQVAQALPTEGGKTKVTANSTMEVTLKGIHELLDLREKKKAAPARTLPPEPPVEPLQAGLGIPGIEKLDRKFNQLRQSLTGIIQRGGERKQMDQTFDATETMANVVARQATNQLRLNGTPAELEAIYPFIESKGDINRLTQFIAQATGKNDKAVAAANYAMQHWNDPHFQALAARAKAISDSQIAQEQAAGINTEYREAYLPHIYDQDLLMGFNRPFVIAGKGTGIGTGFKKGRTFDTIYDAIEAGYPVKTLNAADALEPRIRSGQKLINRVEWSDSFRHVTDPVDGEPVVTSLVRHARASGKPGWEAPPAGYVRRTIIPGVDVAVHEGYASLFDALTGTSRISGSVPGKLALEAEGALKHGLLLFDTYHVSRILQKELFLTGPTKMGWRKGLTLLEYDDATLGKALQDGEITQEMANFARANRGDAELLMRSGLNVGRIQENLYNSVVRQIPILGKFNKWVFEKMTRGAMLQSGLIELERVQRDFGLTKQQAALKVARDLNVYFGNLGRQGLFKSSTAMDVARLVGLAPQWVEGMLRTEVGSVAKAAIDPIKYRRLAVSSLPLSVGTGLAAYFVGTQILNMVTRGHPTWQNPEKGHKLDAWIPDFSGKTAGYFLSPFSVPAEITHDMIRYVRTEPDTISAVSRILSNKASPLWRASKTLLTGKDWDKQKIIGSWNRIKAAAVNLVPAPIGIAPFLMGEKYPGQKQRQITASVGIKTEPAPTGVQQISEVKRNWGLNNPDPKIRHTFEENLKAERAQSDYIPLQRALQVGDMKTAGEEYDKLLTEFGKKSTDIRDAIKPFTGGKEDANGIYRERKNKPIGGMVSEAAEKKFLSTLTPDQKKAYAQALRERELAWSRFLELMKTR